MVSVFANMGVDMGAVPEKFMHMSPRPTVVGMKLGAVF